VNRKKKFMYMMYIKWSYKKIVSLVVLTVKNGRIKNLWKTKFSLVINV